MIIYFIFVSPKWVAHVFDDFPVFHEQVICLIEGLLRVHLKDTSPLDALKPYI